MFIPTPFDLCLDCEFLVLCYILILEIFLKLIIFKIFFESVGYWFINLSNVKTHVQISPQISVGYILNVIPHYSNWLGLPLYIFGFRKMQGCLVAKYY